MTINLNHGEALFLHELPFGSTQSIEIKLGRKHFMADVDKNQSSASIDFYQKLNRDRKKYSKYESMVAGAVFVRNTWSPQVRANSFTYRSTRRVSLG